MIIVTVQAKNSALEPIKGARNEAPHHFGSGWDVVLLPPDGVELPVGGIIGSDLKQVRLLAHFGFSHLAFLKVKWG